MYWCWLSSVRNAISLLWSVGKMKFDAWPVEPPGLGSGPLSICTMSVQPRRLRWPTRQLPTMPAPMMTTFALRRDRLRAVGVSASRSWMYSLCIARMPCHAPPVIYLYRYHATISLSERAYQAIRRMIVRLELAPGAVVRDDELQRQLGLGRTPIREALQRLVRDQFVTVIPRRGMYVRASTCRAVDAVRDAGHPRAVRRCASPAHAARAATGTRWRRRSAAPTDRQHADGAARDRPRVPRDRVGGRRQPVPHRHARHAVRAERPAVAPVPRRRRRPRPT